MSWNHIDFGDYKYELLAGIKHISNCTLDLNAEYRARMKDRYDREHKIDAHRLPNVGDRVHMSFPKEKSSSKHLKLTDEWSGPFRVLEVSDNSALITNLTKNEDPFTVQHDVLILVPHKLDSSPVGAKTKRARRVNKIQRSKNTPIDSTCCRATTATDATRADNSALGLFFTCPGAGCRVYSSDHTNSY